MFAHWRLANDNQVESNTTPWLPRLVRSQKAARKKRLQNCSAKTAVQIYADRFPEIGDGISGPASGPCTSTLVRATRQFDHCCCALLVANNVIINSQPSIQPGTGGGRAQRVHFTLRGTAASSRLSLSKVTLLSFPTSHRRDNVLAPHSTL